MTDLDESPTTATDPGRGRDRSWCAAALRFNLCPALYAHSSWLPDWAQELQQCPPQLQAALSRALLQEQGLDGSYDWELRSIGARLFMLEPTALRALALSLGVSAHRDVFCRIVWQQQLCALRAALGDAFDVLWLGVSASVPKLPGHALEGLLLPRTAAAEAALRHRIEQDGLLQLLRLVDPGHATQRAAAGRAALRLPRALAAMALPPLPGAQAEALSRAIAEQLLARCAPGSSWLLEF